MPSTIDWQYIDDVVRVNDRECMQMTRRLVREEGIFAGGSSGAAVAGALKWIERNDSPELSVLSRERSGRPTVCANAYDIPMPDASQDLVCLFDTLEHIPDEARALREVQRVLGPGGLAFFSVPAYQFLYSNNDRIAHHHKRYTRGGLKRAVSAAGLEPVKLTYFNTFLFPLILPAVLLGKLQERLFGLKDPDRTNLSWQPPGPLNRTLAAVMGSERHLLRWLSFPVGHSLIGVFRRN